MAGAMAQSAANKDAKDAIAARLIARLPHGNIPSFDYEAEAGRFRAISQARKAQAGDDTKDDQGMVGGLGFEPR